LNAASKLQKEDVEMDFGCFLEEDEDFGEKIRNISCWSSKQFNLKDVNKNDKEYFFISRLGKTTPLVGLDKTLLQLRKRDTNLSMVDFFGQWDPFKGK
jgi:hypothetical protein